jgi:uncharacterized coiled-coil protein SlyX
MRTAILAAVSVCALGVGSAGPALADDEVKRELERLRTLVEAQAGQIAAQAAALDVQRRQLDALSSRVRESEASLDAARATGAPPSATGWGAAFASAQAGAVQAGAVQAGAPRAAAERAQPAPPSGPVGEAPPERESTVAQAEVLPEGMGVTLPRGRLTLDPSLEYVNSSNNRLVFRGQPLVATLFNGVFEVSQANRNTIVSSLAARYGLTPRLEIEARVPYLYRNDEIVTDQPQPQSNRTLRTTRGLESSGLGDVELAARYQINRGRPGGPVYLAGLRVKTDTGEGPFDVPFDEFGVAQELATGSGFWAVEPSLTFLLPSDPVVLFGSVSYGINLERTLNREIAPARPGTGTGDPGVPRVFVRSVDPGDSLGFGLGFAFALNDRFSYSMAYRHSMVFETRTELESGVQDSSELQVGVLTVGGSYRLTPKLALNASFDVGVTEDAPDVRVGIRLPYRF